jgi:hypothetical protein
MSITIRDTFIALHGSNVLQRLYDEVWLTGTHVLAFAI